MKDCKENLKVRTWFLLLLISVFFSGCGYSLKSESSYFDSKSISIASDASSLNISFKEELLTLNNSIISSKEIEQKQADLIIIIQEHRISKYIAAKGLGSRTREVRLDYHLSFELKNTETGNKNLHTLEDVKYITFNESQILAYESAEAMASKAFIKYALKRIEMLASEI